MDGSRQSLILDHFSLKESAPESNIKPASSGGIISTEPKLSYKLSLIDNKTRPTYSIPAEKDQRQSHLQLMLYRHLLSSLLVPELFLECMSKITSPPTRASSFRRGRQALSKPAEAPAKLNFAAPFSPAFIQSMEYLCEGNGLGDITRNSTCLEDLVSCWVDAVEGLALDEKAPLDTELELVYRLRERPPARSRSRGRKSRSRSPSSGSGVIIVEAPPGLAAPVGSSTSASPSVGAVQPVESEPRERGLATDLGVGTRAVSPARTRWQSPGVEEDVAMAWAIQESLKASEQNANVFGYGTFWVWHRLRGPMVV